MFEVLNQISNIGIVPVVKIDDAKDAVPLAKALINGGLPCAEITFRTAAAKDAIKAISQNCPEMLVGAGTVLTTKQADDAMQAGAKFLVSPGLNEEVVAYCLQKGYPITPGVCNPSDIEKAISLGLDTVKFFPAEAAGGLEMIKAMSAPYVNVKFMPTGGISAINLNDYLDFKKVIACGGSWMVKDSLINDGKFDEIEKLTKKAVETMLGFELGHLGINSENDEKADKTANTFCDVFGFAKTESPVSFWCDKSIEVMKYQGRGKQGHIAIKTNYIHRAIRYLESKGYTFDHDSKIYNDRGELILIYINLDFGGFDLHLSQK